MLADFFSLWDVIYNLSRRRIGRVLMGLARFSGMNSLIFVLIFGSLEAQQKTK